MNSMYFYTTEIVSGDPANVIVSNVTTGAPCIAVMDSTELVRVNQAIVTVVEAATTEAGVEPASVNVLIVRVDDIGA